MSANQASDENDDPAQDAPAAPVRSPANRVRPARRVRRLGLLGLGIAALALAAAGCDARVDAGVLTVRGIDNAADTIALRLAEGDSTTLEVDRGNDGSVEHRFARSAFTRIVVDGLGGDDTLVIDESRGTFTTTEITDLRGGAGADVLVGGSGAERIDGGPGNDQIEGNRGEDSVDGSDGDDRFAWAVGDGDDDIDGGPGTDRVLADGTDESESYSVGAVGRRARLVRESGGIRLDLDAVEALDLATASGVDFVAVADVTPTDLVTITTNIAGAGGADDGVLDEVLVPPDVTIGRTSSGPIVDGLGARVVVAGGAATDRIHVTGTEATETVAVDGTSSADTLFAVASGPDVVLDTATASPLVVLSAIDTIDADLGGGPDTFSATGNVAALTRLDVDGGPGADTIRGGNGPDVLSGGDGVDLIDGQQGDDQLAGGAGDDTVQWDPGDGNETVDGGSGADRLAFNGSNAAEIVSLAAVGGHAQLTRNLANVVVDLAGVEAVDVAAVGGADVVQIGDLSGTGLTTVTPNLAAFGGGDDAQTDEVIVPPGMPIGRDGATTVVGGLGAQVRVVGGTEATDRVHVTGPTATDVVPLSGTGSADTVDVVANGTDAAVFGATPGVHLLLTSVERLDVTLGNGDDRFTATGNVAPLVALRVDGGPGADTLLGGNGADALIGGADADHLDGQQGIDGIDGGAGADVVQWDPGDGNDSVAGGTGQDRFVFNGSAAAEVLSLSGTAGQVRFTRNIANVDIGLDDVEAVDLNAVGGADVVQVGDLTGTDLTTVTANLFQAGGAATDATADQVTVAGTAGDDVVTVDADGTAVVTSGLWATVRVVGADPTLDRLTVSGLAGTDTVTGTPAAAALVLLELLP